MAKKSNGKGEKSEILFEEIERIGLLHKSDDGKAKVRVRLVETKAGLRIDIRKHLDLENFKGYTKQGIILDRKMLAKLAKLLPAMQKALKSGSAKEDAE